MTTYRVDIDGETVWTEERDQYDGLSVFPPEHFARPVEVTEGEAHPSPHYLYLDDVLVGVQRTHRDEADELDAAASIAEAAGDPVGAFGMRLDAHAARALSADALGDVVSAAQHRAARAQYMVEQLTASPALAAVLQAKGS